MTNKLWKCCGCKDFFERIGMITIPAGHFCNIDCAIKLANARNKKTREKAERLDTKERKAALLTVSDWIKKVHKYFNPYIRLRDKLLPCISCGRSAHEVENTEGWKTGGAWDCGHFLSVGAHSHLRFDPRNAHKQCKSCNGGSGKYTRKNHTVSKEYRERIIIKIGLEYVEWLEGPHPTKKWTIDELKGLETHFKTLLKELTS
ncbi:MAG: recombination protein NinG [Nitrosomonadaceae bacterium]